MKIGNSFTLDPGTLLEDIGGCESLMTKQKSLLTDQLTI